MTMTHDPSAIDERESIRHAQEYLRLIASAPSCPLRDEATLQAQRYFQSLLECRLITLQTYHSLNDQALAQADTWQPPEPC